MKKLIVNCEAVESEVNRLSELLEEYQQLYRSLFTEVDQSSLFWKGKDQQTFISKIHESESDFNQLFQLLQQYIAFMDKSMQSYRLCQDEAQSSILRL